MCTGAEHPSRQIQCRVCPCLFNAVDPLRAWTSDKAQSIAALTPVLSLSFPLKQHHCPKQELVVDALRASWRRRGDALAARRAAALAALAAADPEDAAAAAAPAAALEAALEAGAANGAVHLLALLSGALRADQAAAWALACHPFAPCMEALDAARAALPAGAAATAAASSAAAAAAAATGNNTVPDPGSVAGAGPPL